MGGNAALATLSCSMLWLRNAEVYAGVSLMAEVAECWLKSKLFKTRYANHRREHAGDKTASGG